MATLSKNPIYNLSAVLRETGLKADLVRAWERRYNLPNPQRSAGGHRLYSQYDIETLKWLKEKQAQGLSISNAVELWRTEEQLGRDPLARGEDGGQVEKEIESANDEVLPKLRQRWIDACLNFGNAAAEDALTQAFAVHPVEMVVSEVLQSGLREIGQGWLERQVQRAAGALRLCTRGTPVANTAHAHTAPHPPADCTSGLPVG